MKKAFALILALCLALSMVSAMAATPAELVGTWYVEYKETSNDRLYPTVNYQVDMNRDGSISMTLGEQSATGTWEATDEGVSLVIDFGDGHKNYYDGVLADGKISGDSFQDLDGRYYDFTFSRDQALWTIPADVEVTKEDDYFGNYELYMVQYGDWVVSVEDPAALKVKIEFAQVTYYNPPLTDELEMTVLSDFQDNKIVADGKYVASYSSKNIECSKTENGIKVALEDGSVCYLRSVDGDIAAVERVEEVVDEVIEEVVEEVEAEVEGTTEETPAE